MTDGTIYDGPNGSKMQLKGKNLHLTLPLDPKGRPSQSGKSIIKYSTGGFDRNTLSALDLAVSINITTSDK